MNTYIQNFTKQLSEALEIGDASKFLNPKKKYSNILICGLGGSGIGGTIVNDILSPLLGIPILSSKDYSVPNFVDKNTLAIFSSYSGNTEETLFALKECQNRKTEICIITSGGKLEVIAKNNNYNTIIVPANHPPRAMFGYSFTQIFFMLSNYGIITDNFKNDFKKTILLLTKEGENIKKQALEIASKMYQKTPVIYVASGFEGVAIRFRQQINENSKMLCWHHVVPEMNHNELLGWRTNVNDLSVIYFRNHSDFDRNQKRIEINKDVISKYTKNITEVWSQGNSKIENTLYHINLGDWVSWYLSEMNNVDAIEIDVINFLKKKLSKI